MNLNDLHQLWVDALDDVPTEAIAEPLWQSVQLGLRARRRRRRIVQASALATVMLIAISVLRYLPLAPNELARDPQPTPLVQVTIAPTPPTPEPPHLATTPPAAPESPATSHVVLESVPLKEFLAQLPHHGFVEIKNERGRFLVVVDNETGETFTTVLSTDDTL